MGERSPSLRRTKIALASGREDDAKEGAENLEPIEILHTCSDTHSSHLR